MYRREPPTDKTIREWYMKFQQSGCLCAAKRRGRPGPILPLYAFIAWTGITVFFFNLYLGFEQCTYKSSVPVAGCTEEESFEFS